VHKTQDNHNNFVKVQEVKEHKGRGCRNPRWVQGGRAEKVWPKSRTKESWARQPRQLCWQRCQWSGSVADPIGVRAKQIRRRQNAFGQRDECKHRNPQSRQGKLRRMRTNQ